MENYLNKHSGARQRQIENGTKSFFEFCLKRRLQTFLFAITHVLNLPGCDNR